MDLVAGYKIGQECSRVSFLEVELWDDSADGVALKPRTDQRIQALLNQARQAFDDKDLNVLNVSLRKIARITLKRKVVYPVPYEPFEVFGFWNMIEEILQQIPSLVEVGINVVLHCIKCLSALSYTPGYCELIEHSFFDVIMALFKSPLSDRSYLYDILRIFVNISSKNWKMQ